MEMKICQSCGMPLDSQEVLATNADNTKNEDYCIYCYKDGHFTNNFTMDEMIDFCIQFTDEFNKNSEIKITPSEARTMMKEFFPTLKRWKK